MTDRRPVPLPRPRSTAPSPTGTSTRSTSAVELNKLINEQVARKLLAKLVNSQGVVTFMAQTWHEFYQEAIKAGSGDGQQSQRSPGFLSSLRHSIDQSGGEEQQSPKLSDFLSSFQHLFAFNETAGGRCTEIRPCLKIGPCRKFLRRGVTCDNEKCPKLHCCEFFLFGNCTQGDSCHYPHCLTDSHNAHVLQRHLLEGLPVDDLAILLSAQAPKLCFRYNGKNECTDADCPQLHLCRHYVNGECKNARCNRSHDVLSDQSKKILKRYGFNLALGSDKILEKLRSKMTSAGNQDSPEICFKYNSSEGCSFGDGCTRLHLCNRYATTEGHCSFGANCRSNHDVLSNQTRAVLVNCGFDVEIGAGTILAQLASILSARKGNQESTARGKDAVKKTPQICDNYNKMAGCQAVKCPKLHVCAFFIDDSCKFNKGCKRSHDIRSEQPLGVLRGCGFDMAAMSDDNILSILRQAAVEQASSTVKEDKPKGAHTKAAATIDRRGQSKNPQVCDRYNRMPGCKEAKCCMLHICQHFFNGSCKFGTNCKRSHNIRSEQPLGVLKECGFDMAAMSDEQIMSRLKQAATSAEAADEKPKRGTQRTEKAAADDNEMRVCSFHLSGRCNYGSSCTKYHSSSRLPYQWQYLSSDDQKTEWRDFTTTANDYIESRYCQVSEESCETTDDRIGGKVRIDFNNWLVFGIGSDGLTAEVRRLGTESAVVSSKRNRFSTVWLWYWQKDDGLWQAFANVMAGKEDSGLPKNRNPNESGGSTPATDGSVTFQGEPTSSDFELQHLENQNSKIRYQRLIGSDNVKFLINNLASMTQINMKTNSQNKLRRRPQLFRLPEKTSSSTPLAVNTVEQKVNYPACWDIATLKDESQDFVKVSVLNSGQTASEYQEIASLFGATMPNSPIKALYRIQNRDLWEEFDTFKTRMNRKRSSPAREERLFHGTNLQYVDAICQQGFDWRLNGMSVGAVYGKGSYFAKNASYSKSYTSTGTMFVVKVIVGDYTKGDGSMVRPPPKDPSKPFQELFDSCVNDATNPAIFVVFERSQAYPEYLIEF